MFTRQHAIVGSLLGLLITSSLARADVPLVPLQPPAPVEGPTAGGGLPGGIPTVPGGPEAPAPGSPTSSAGATSHDLGHHPPNAGGAPLPGLPKPGEGGMVAPSTPDVVPDEPSPPEPPKPEDAAGNGTARGTRMLSPQPEPPDAPPPRPNVGGPEAATPPAGVVHPGGGAGKSPTPEGPYGTGGRAPRPN
jgi:translation initiation factor IF-2